jgi:hypothetical protein
MYIRHTLLLFDDMLMVETSALQGRASKDKVSCNNSRLGEPACSRPAVLHN